MFACRTTSSGRLHRSFSIVEAWKFTRKRKAGVTHPSGGDLLEGCLSGYRVLLSKEAIVMCSIPK